MVLGLKKKRIKEVLRAAAALSGRELWEAGAESLMCKIVAALQKIGGAHCGPDAVRMESKTSEWPSISCKKEGAVMHAEALRRVEMLFGLEHGLFALGEASRLSFKEIAAADGESRESEKDAWEKACEGCLVALKDHPLRHRLPRAKKRKAGKVMNGKGALAEYEEGKESNDGGEKYKESEEEIGRAHV